MQRFHGIKIGKKYTLEVGEEIEIVTGKSSIYMNSEGKITIQGTDVNVISTAGGSGKGQLNLKGVDITTRAKGEIDTKAQKNITVKGKKILDN